jgi:hypothetical protein
MKPITRKLRCGAELKVEEIVYFHGGKSKYLTVTVVNNPENDRFARSFQADSLEEANSLPDPIDNWHNSVQMIVGINNLRILRHTIDLVLENLKKG